MLLLEQTVRLFRDEDRAGDSVHSRGGSKVLGATLVFPGDVIAEIVVDVNMCWWQIRGLPVEISGDIYRLYPGTTGVVEVSISFTSEAEEAQVTVKNVGPAAMRFAVVPNGDYSRIRERCRTEPSFPSVPADALIPGPERYFIASVSVAERIQHHGEEWYEMSPRVRHTLIEKILNQVRDESEAYDSARAHAVLDKVSSKKLGDSGKQATASLTVG